MKGVGDRAEQRCAWQGKGTGQGVQGAEQISAQSKAARRAEQRAEQSKAACRTEQSRVHRRAGTVQRREAQDSAGQLRAVERKL